MKAWLFQDPRQRAKLGDADCPWSVGWIDPGGKRKSKSIGSKSLAEKFSRKIEGQLAAGSYEATSSKAWADFMVEYESKVLAGMEPGTRDAMQSALNHFERIAKPVEVRAITTSTIDAYVAARRLEPRRPVRKATGPRRTAGLPVAAWAPEPLRRV